MTLIFSGILTLTYNATSLILPTSANITTQAGDCMDIESKGAGNWVCTGYQRADGNAVSAIPPSVPNTQVTYVAGENLTQGNAVYISSDGKAYKTDGTNTAKIGFIGFADQTVSTGASVKVNMSGVDSRQS